MSGLVAYSGCVFWEEDGEHGAVVGQDSRLRMKEMEAKRANAWERKSRSDYVYWAVEIAAKLYFHDNPSCYNAQRGGYEVRDPEELSKFLGAMEEALVAAQGILDGAPLPDWAAKALAAGWKAPKGWKP